MTNDFYQISLPNNENNKLNEQQHYVTQQGGTEPAFSGAYHQHKEVGEYHCICCDKPLFSSTTKYDSGTGWPSFYNCINSSHIKRVEDNKLWMRRTEVQCANCQAHLGHVFPDGPAPTYERYCINSAALQFHKKNPSV